MKRRNGETERWGLSPTLMVRRDARRKGARERGRNGENIVRKRKVKNDEEEKKEKKEKAAKAGYAETGAKGKDK